MLIIKSPSNNAYFNIAAEEYILENFEEDVFLLYINNPSIIIGRYQNTISQLNLDFIRQHGIKVVRRLSGGGAVFHDKGNLNFCFICNKQENDVSGFERYTQPVISYLKTLGVNASLQGRNDLVIDGRKFSGNARLATDTKVLQHGTILYSSHMRDLSNALKTDPLKFKDKAVKSIRSRVTNVCEHLGQQLSVKEFENGLISHITSHYVNTARYEYTEDDLLAIDKKMIDKYSTWDWNYGVSPAYNFDKTMRTAGGSINVQLMVTNGIISDFNLSGDFFTRKSLQPLKEAFINCKHQHESVLAIIEKLQIENYLVNITGEDLLCAMF